jgi:hypothetical protein
VICTEQTGRFVADAETDSARIFLAHGARVVYAVSPIELKDTIVIKRKAMIEYHEISSITDPDWSCANGSRVRAP